MREIMKDPADIPNEFITTNQPDTNKGDSRPGQPGWTPKVPQNPSEEKPSLTVNLTPKDEEPVLVEYVKVTGVQVVTILISTRETKTTPAPSPSGSTPISATTPTSRPPAFVPVVEKERVPRDGIVRLPRPIRVSELTVILEEPEPNPDGTKPKKYKTTVGIHACKKYPGIAMLLSAWIS